MILCNDLHKQFGDVEAVKGVSMEIPATIAIESPLLIFFIVFSFFMVRNHFLIQQNQPFSDSQGPNPANR